jgi:hypothetical protein
LILRTFVQLETIALVAERYKVSSVARVARRRLNGGYVR